MVAPLYRSMGAIMITQVDKPTLIFVTPQSADKPGGRAIIPTGPYLLLPRVY